MDAAGDGRELERHAQLSWHLHGATDTDPHALRAALTSGTLVAAADATARRFPDREAMRVDGEGIDQRTLADATRRLAGYLRNRGTTVGSRIVIAGPNSISFVVAYLGAVRAGAAVTLVSPMLQQAELIRLVDNVSPVMAIVSSDRDAQLAGHSVPRLSLDPGPGSIHLAIAGTPPVEHVDIESGSVVHLAYTSGTTGRPKATPLTHGNVLASVRAVIGAWRWSSADILVHSLPMQHAHGLTALHLTLLTGSRSVVASTFDPHALCTTLGSVGATVLFGVPTVLERLLTSGALAGANLSTLRLVTSGSAPLSPQSSDALALALGTRPLERYGLTEAGFVLSNPYAGPRVAGSVGHPLAGVEVDLVDSELNPVPDGVDGEILVRGPQVFGGYLGDEDLADSWLPSGWFRTGDIGIRSPDTGAISITGRLKELIISGGLNVNPREVELVIEGQAGVHAAAVVGVPSARWGEEVTAFIEADADLDTEQLLAALRSVLAAYKCPKRCIVIDSLPRNHMGKLVRRELQARAAQG